MVGPENIQDGIGRVIGETNLHGAQLYLQAAERIARGDVDDDVLAALAFVTSFTGATASYYREMRRLQGGRRSAQTSVFPTSPVMQELGAETFVPPVEDSDNDVKPTTFGELLREKVASLIAEPIDIGQIENTFEINISGDTKNWSKDDFVNVVVGSFKKTSDRFELLSDYTRLQLMQRLSVKAPQLDRWGAEINFDWNDHPSVDSTTALDIRGLGKFEKELLQQTRVV